MKLKNMLAGVAACAIAVSGLAVTASAKITNANSNDNYQFDVTEAPSGRNFGEVYGVEITLDGKVTNKDEQVNVGYVTFQSDSIKFDEIKATFSNEGYKEQLNVTIDGDNKIVYTSTRAIFNANDKFAQVFVVPSTDEKQIDYSVKSVKLLDKDGKELTAAATTTKATTTTKAGATTKAGTTTAAGSKTGDAGVGIAVGGLALAAAAAVAARKKH